MEVRDLETLGPLVASERNSPGPSGF